MNFKTTDLCDEHLEHEHLQVAEPIFRDFGGVRRFFGEIVTLKVLHDNALVRQTLEVKGGGHVLVVDGGASIKRALLGDQLAELGAKNGWAGVIINGAVRDADELATVPIGVKALATCPVRSEKKGLGQSDVLLRFAGITFAPGHFVYADADGIVVSPKVLH